MALTLYAHPFSSYCQKVLIALWEKDLAFTYRHLEDPDAGAELAALWPLGRFPVLVDDGRTVAETSIIIEHLDQRHPGPAPLIPADPAAALEVRLLDRIFDQYVSNAMQQPVYEALRPAPDRLDESKDKACDALERAYAWLDARLAGRVWAAGDAFSMADCAAAPALLYSDWVHRIGSHLPTLAAYRARLLARPTIARAVEEARPYRPNFPLGAPDRD
jgi:glutathione S-transferase